MAIDLDDRVYITYGMGVDVYVSISEDKGQSYAEPVKLGEIRRLALGMRRGPRITAHRGVVTVTAISHDTGDISAYRSSDRGKTWSSPARVNDVSGSAREGLHGMAVAPDGTIVCTWLDLRDKGTKLFMAVSRDGGAKWSENLLVYVSPSGTICECCHPSLAFDAKGKLYVMFRNFADGARDMYLTSSTDMRTFTPATKLGEGTWMLRACPMDGGMLSVDEKGVVQTLWRREDTVFQSNSTTPEKPLDKGRQPWITRGSRGAILTWQRGNDIVIAAGAEPRVVSVTGSSPVVASSPNGKLTVAAWTEKGIRAQAFSP